MISTVEITLRETQTRRRERKKRSHWIKTTKTKIKKHSWYVTIHIKTHISIIWNNFQLFSLNTLLRFIRSFNSLFLSHIVSDIFFFFFLSNTLNSLVLSLINCLYANYNNVPSMLKQYDQMSSATTNDLYIFHSPKAFQFDCFHSVSISSLLCILFTQRELIEEQKKNKTRKNREKFKFIFRSWGA